MIRIATSIPDAFVRRADYVFHQFGERWGIPVRVSHDGDGRDADLRYGAFPAPEGGRAAVDVPFDERLYEPACPCAPRSDDGIAVWDAAERDGRAPDLVGSSYRLLTLLDEQQVDPALRDRRGVFLTSALPAGRHKVAALPLVDDQAALLLQRLERIRPGLTASAVPRWPDGKRYAIAVTHDTDAITLGAPRELATNLAKFVVRRDRTFGAMARTGLRYVRNPTGNPLFGFPGWRSFEFARGLRSCFYLYARVAPIKRDLNNCKSSVVEQPIDWTSLRALAADGWEFGLHAPINAKDSLDALAGGKQWLEGRLGVPLYGLRHHYWALDWLAPHTTFRRHVNSGFRYDSSIAWQDVAGFRAGTCHPYRPFDLEREKVLNIYELPACLMDGHVLAESPDPASAVRAAREAVGWVKQRGGVAVLDWHTETACDRYVYRGYLTALGQILAPLLEDDDIWWATPWEIVKHCHGRSAALQAAP